MIKNLSIKDIALSAIISILSVIFLWGFWTRGVNSLGFNFTIILLIFLGGFLSKVNNFKEYFYRNYYWILGVLCLILSFSFYENPFLKAINIFVIPISLTFFIGVSITEFIGKNTWNFKVIFEIFLRKLPFSSLSEKIYNYVNSKVDESIVKKTLLGLTIFVLLDIFVILLLAGADKNFESILTSFWQKVDLVVLVKIIFAFIIFVILLVLNLNWEKKYLVDFQENDKKLDPIISGIVLVGVFLTYLLFISVQFSSLFGENLPSTTQDIALFVKSGFWQLFFVSIVNIILLFIYFKKTNKLLQNVLFVFVIASILILFSASSKMYLYIVNFGFSYEKFFASYVVLFFGILFLIFLFLIFNKKKFDILKATIILAFLMYSFINIIPSEKIMFETNLSIAKNQTNKMQKFQSHIFSIDILSSVNKLKGTAEYKDTYWDEWTKKRISEFNQKKWYEKNINYLFIDRKGKNK